MNDKLFVNEVRGFLFYSKLIWPIHRKLAKSLITPRCKKCIISANCLPLNSAGLCSVCAETKPPISKTSHSSIESKDLAQQMNHIVVETLSTNKSQYDAVF